MDEDEDDTKEYEGVIAWFYYNRISLLVILAIIGVTSLFVTFTEGTFLEGKFIETVCVVGVVGYVLTGGYELKRKRKKRKK